tara:strand:+ start:46 stop:339 length:294 start_codon:yes stop_codon:yes gene_type:complete
MSKALIKKGLNADLINHIYSFLTFKDEFDKVIQQLNEASVSNAQLKHAQGSVGLWPTPSVIWERCNTTNTYLKSFVWWPPTLTLFGGKGYIVLINYN